MPRRLLNWSVALVAVLACSYVLLAQNSGNSGAAKGKPAAAKSDASKGAWQVPKTAWGEPDFQGMWEPKMPASAREFAGYSFVSHRDVVPLMTAWGKQQYEMTKPSWGPRAVEDSTDMVNPTTGSEIGCAPTGVPRIWVQPFPMEILQVPGRVVQLFEFNHFVRQIYTTGTHEHARSE